MNYDRHGDRDRIRQIVEIDRVGLDIDHLHDELRLLLVIGVDDQIDRRLEALSTSYDSRLALAGRGDEPIVVYYGHCRILTRPDDSDLGHSQAVLKICYRSEAESNDGGTHEVRTGAEPEHD